MGSSRGAALPWLAFVAACADAPSHRAGDLEVRDIAVRMAPAGATTAAIYFVARNAGREADTLLGITSDAGAVTLHETMDHGDGAGPQMHGLEWIALPPGDSVRFAIGARHGMLEGFTRALRVGDSLALQFRFARTGMIDVRTVVRPVGEE